MRYDEIIGPDAACSEDGAEDANGVAIPAYQFEYQPLPRHRPVSRMLTRALQIYHGLFLYYARPILKTQAERVRDTCTHGEYLGCQCGGPVMRGFSPAKRPSVDVLPHVHCLEQRVQELTDTCRTFELVGYNTPEPPPEDPDKLLKPLAGGWELHPMAQEPLEACGQQIRKLTEVFQKADPDMSAASVLSAAQAASKLRPCSIIGFEDRELFVWPYPNNILQVVRGMDDVADFEKQLVAGGWVPDWADENAADEVVPEQEQEWSKPLRRTEIVRRLLDPPNPRARQFHDLVEPHYETEQVDNGSWRIRLDTLATATREKLK